METHQFSLPIFLAATLILGQASKAGADNIDIHSSAAPVLFELHGTLGKSPMKLGVSTWEAQEPEQIVEQVLDAHFATSSEYQKLDQAVTKYRSASQRHLMSLKDSAQYSLGYQGFNPSKRVGNLIVDNTAVVRDDSTAEFEKQKYVDTIHHKVITSLMEIAMGLGQRSQSARAKMIASGRAELDILIGEDLAQKTITAMSKCLAQSAVTSRSTQLWDVTQKQHMQEALVEAALNNDPVVQKLKEKLGHYANKGTTSTLSSQVIEGGLNAATIAIPGIGLPLLTGSLVNGYALANGGSEERKLEKIVVYDSRLTARSRLINQEIAMAIDNYSFGRATKNQPLQIFSQAVIANLATQAETEKLLGTSISKDSQKFAPEIKTAKITKLKSKDAIRMNLPDTGVDVVNTQSTR